LQTVRYSQFTAKDKMRLLKCRNSASTTVWHSDLATRPDPVDRWPSSNSAIHCLYEEQ